MYYVITKTSGTYEDKETTPVFVTLDKIKGDLFVAQKDLAVKSVEIKRNEFHKKLAEYRSTLNRLYYGETVDSMVREYRTTLHEEIFGEEPLTEDENEHYEDDVYYQMEEVPEL